MTTESQIVTTCGEILDELGIRPFEKRALTWHMPPEIIEEHLPPDMPLNIGGYPVHMEPLLGETTIVLTETLYHRSLGFLASESTPPSTASTGSGSGAIPRPRSRAGPSRSRR